MADEAVKDSPGSPKAGTAEPRKVVAGMEHLADSESVQVRVNGPSYTRMDPHTGRVKRYQRNSVVTVTRAELETLQVNGVQRAGLIEVKEEDEGE